MQRFKKLAYVHDLASQTPPLFEIDQLQEWLRDSTISMGTYSRVSQPFLPELSKTTYSATYMLTVHICMIREKLFALIIMSLQLHLLQLRDICCSHLLSSAVSFQCSRYSYEN